MVQKGDYKENFQLLLPLSAWLQTRFLSFLVSDSPESHGGFGRADFELSQSSSAIMLKIRGFFFLKVNNSLLNLKGQHLKNSSCANKVPGVARSFGHGSLRGWVSEKAICCATWPALALLFHSGLFSIPLN